MQRLVILLLTLCNALAMSHPAIIMNNITSKFSDAGTIIIMTEKQEEQIPVDEWIISDNAIHIKSGYIILPKKFGHTQTMPLPKSCSTTINPDNIFSIDGTINNNGSIENLNCTIKAKNAS